MSFNIKGKTVVLSLMSLVTLIVTITFCVLVIKDSTTYGESFKNIMLVIIGYFFNHESQVKKELEKNERNKTL